MPQCKCKRGCESCHTANCGERDSYSRVARHVITRVYLTSCFAEQLLLLPCTTCLETQRHSSAPAIQHFCTTRVSNSTVASLYRRLIPTFTHRARNAVVCVYRKNRSCIFHLLCDAYFRLTSFFAIPIASLIAARVLDRVPPSRVWPLQECPLRRPPVMAVQPPYSCLPLKTTREYLRA
jgi:hypothetical protein